MRRRALSERAAARSRGAGTEAPRCSLLRAHLPHPLPGLPHPTPRRAPPPRPARDQRRRRRSHQCPRSAAERHWRPQLQGPEVRRGEWKPRDRHPSGRRCRGAGVLRFLASEESSACGDEASSARVPERRRGPKDLVIAAANCTQWSGVRALLEEAVCDVVLVQEHHRPPHLVP